MARATNQVQAKVRLAQEQDLYSTYDSSFSEDDYYTNNYRRKKSVNPIAAFFAGAVVSPFVASAGLIGTALEATWDITKGVGIAVADLIVVDVAFPLAILASGAKEGWKVAGPYFPLNILTAAIGLTLATVPAVAIATLGVVRATVDVVAGVCNAAWTLLKGISVSVASLFVLPAACAYDASKNTNPSMGTVGLLNRELGEVLKAYKGTIKGDSLFDFTSTSPANAAYRQYTRASVAKGMNFDLPTREYGSNSALRTEPRGPKV
jgi:hypothetical protein